MKKTIKSTLVVVVLICSLSVSGQTKYYTGFDSDAEKENWDEYLKGKTGTAHWEIGTGGVSDPGRIIHYAPTGDADKDSLDNWYVSPKFDFSEGGAIDSLKYNYFAYLGTFFEEQFVGVYLLTGSKDPALASSKVLLADLTSKYSGDISLWQDTSNITIPTTSGDCYIAFNFVAIDGWSSISFDNLYVTMNKTLGIDNGDYLQNLVKVYPNPSSSDILHIESDLNIKDVTIVNNLGQIVFNGTLTASIDISNLQPGHYAVRMKTDNEKEIVKKLVIK
ncbi:MAG: hypothetical protein COA58_13210 [Bacteroidetes bacterium]|nr:MAG: hypothetical protein COA58_13210 [Bacteroidota bacterium]